MNATVVPVEGYDEDVYMLMSLMRIAVAGGAVGCLLYSCASVGYHALIKRYSPAYIAMVPLDEKSSAV